MRIDSGFVEPFDFAAVGARQPTSRARVLEVRIQSPPGESLRTIGSAKREVQILAANHPRDAAEPGPCVATLS